MVEVVALARALATPANTGVALVLDGDVTDELHHVDGLAHARAAEQPHLAALGEGADEIDDLDPGLEQLAAGGLFGEGGCGTVNGPALLPA